MDKSWHLQRAHPQGNAREACMHLKVSQKVQDGAGELSSPADHLNKLAAQFSILTGGHEGPPFSIRWLEKRETGGRQRRSRAFICARFSTAWRKMAAPRATENRSSPLFPWTQICNHRTPECI